jgi:hypothetical protein
VEQAARASQAVAPHCTARRLARRPALRIGAEHKAITAASSEGSATASGRHRHQERTPGRSRVDLRHRGMRQSRTRIAEGVSPLRRLPRKASPTRGKSKCPCEPSTYRLYVTAAPRTPVSPLARGASEARGHYRPPALQNKWNSPLHERRQLV